MTVDPRTDIPDAGELRALWAGLLLAPAAFLLNLELAYALVPTACSTGTRLLMHIVHLVCLLLAAAGALTAWRSWRLTGRPGLVGQGAGSPGAVSWRAWGFC
jgi:hypothetical protein